MQAGDHPQAKPVFDLDCISLLEIARTLRDEHQFQSGRKITYAPRVFLGAAAQSVRAAATTGAPQRLAKKIAAGAQFIQTQYCFDVPRLRAVHGAARGARACIDEVFILVGVGPLRSAKAADWMRTQRAGHPHSGQRDLRRARRARRTRPREGRKLCVDLIQEIREIKGVHGVHVMAYRQEESVAEDHRAIGVLDGRIPWHPPRDGNPTPVRTAS